MPSVSLAYEELSLANSTTRQARSAHRQELRRERECRARRRAVGFCEQSGRPRSTRQAAPCLGISPRTLAHWRRRLVHDELLPRPRGRPCLEPAAEDHAGVWAVLEETGPALGLPTLRTCFPEVPRCILADLLGDYRRMYQSEHRLVVEALQWTRPGLVWAIDHTQPPRPIDGVSSQVLAVRDLASGLQLAWTAVADATADEALLVLESLFHTYGPPLVLKSDNGSAFISHRWKELLERWQIAPLLSPPRTPRYNGSCEAGIGAGKTRTAYLAARQGRAGLWTSDDLAAARDWANEHHYPWGPSGGTPAERFAARQPLDVAQRAAFLADIQIYETQYQTEVQAENTPLTTVMKALIRRRAVRRALVEHGWLLITRRSIPQPFRSLKRAKIS